MGVTSRARRRHALRSAAALLVLALTPAGQQKPPPPPAEAGQQAQARPIVRAVRTVGNVRYTSDQLVSAFGQHTGEPLLGETELRRGVEVLFDTFHVRAVVEMVPLAGGDIELLLRIEELPLDIELRITGNVEISDDKVREWAGLGTREELYLFQAPRIRERLLQHYHDEGYYFAEVRVVERPAGVDPATGQPTAPDVIFEIK